jgi:hypothetical protein
MHLLAVLLLVRAKLKGEKGGGAKDKGPTGKQSFLHLEADGKEVHSSKILPLLAYAQTRLPARLPCLAVHATVFCACSARLCWRRRMQRGRAPGRRARTKRRTEDYEGEELRDGEDEEDDDEDDDFLDDYLASKK